MFGNPTDGALITLFNKLQITIEDSTRLEEIPFSHEQKWMGVRCAVESAVSESVSRPHRPVFIIVASFTQTCMHCCSLSWLNVCFTSHLQGNEGVYYVKGATENVLKLCTHQLVNGKLKSLTQYQKECIEGQVHKNEDLGMRCESAS